MQYTFQFYFADLGPELAVAEFPGWGGNIGTAFNRAWKALRMSKKYKDIKKCRPTRIGIIYPNTRKDK